MGCGVNAAKFFNEQEYVPYYVYAYIDYRNRARERRGPIRSKMDNRSFSIGPHLAYFQEFKAAEVNEEFYKLAQSQKLNYNRFIEVAQVKFPHVLVHEVAEYLLTEKYVFNQQGSQSTAYSYITRPICREEYVYLTFVMTHWKIVRLHPMLALFLYVDDQHYYVVSYGDLCYQFISHFDTTEVEFMRVFKLSKKQRNTQSIDFQQYIKRIQYLEQAFTEVNAFVRCIPETSDASNVSSVVGGDGNCYYNDIINRIRVEAPSERGNTENSSNSAAGSQIQAENGADTVNIDVWHHSKLAETSASSCTSDAYSARETPTRVDSSVALSN